MLNPVYVKFDLVGVVDDIMRNLQFERAQQAGVASMRAPAMRGDDQKPATHFVDQESKLAVPLKKGKYPFTMH